MADRKPTDGPLIRFVGGALALCVLALVVMFVIAVGMWLF